MAQRQDNIYQYFASIFCINTLHQYLSEEVIRKLDKTIDLEVFNE
jgi:hypothetical protein